MSEIDDIFAKRPVASTSALVPPKKKQKKGKAPESAPEKNVSVSSSKKRPAPETIVDPSTRPPPQKKSKVDKPPVADKDDTERFKDSRGSGPRTFLHSIWDPLTTFPQDKKQKKGGLYTKKMNLGSVMRVEVCCLLLCLLPLMIARHAALSF
jgi:hypothetical protein